MPLLSRRQVHAALAGAAAAATWLAAAELGSKRPVRVGALFLLSSSALAGVVGMGASHRASVKATVTEARFNNLLANGGQFGGDIHVTGDHYVTGTLHSSGGTDSHGTVDLHGATGSACLNNVTEINKTAGGTWGAWGTLFMNGHDIVMGGGVVR